MEKKFLVLEIRRMSVPNKVNHMIEYIIVNREFAVFGTYELAKKAIMDVYNEYT